MFVPNKTKKTLPFFFFFFTSSFPNNSKHGTRRQRLHTRRGPSTAPRVQHRHAARGPHPWTLKTAPLSPYSDVRTRDTCSALFCGKMAKCWKKMEKGVRQNNSFYVLVAHFDNALDSHYGGGALFAPLCRISFSGMCACHWISGDRWPVLRKCVKRSEKYLQKNGKVRSLQ